MKKKGIIITIIVILSILILAGGVFAYIFFCTDLLLSEKQGFGKYAMQLAESEDGFISNSVNEYLLKKESSPYNTNGKISANVDILEDTSNSLEMQEYEKAVEFGNNTNITFTGKVDNANNRTEQDITVNYSDTVKLPFKFKVYGDIYGIQADSLSETYIAIENNNLQEFAQKFGVEDVSNIPNKIETTKELDSLNLSEEEKTHIQTQYILPIYNNLGEEKFSKVENADGSVVYTLTLTSSEIKSIYLQLLNTLKSDRTMINKINSIMEEMYAENYDETDAITSEDIQSEIDYVTEQEWEDGTLKININQNNRKTNKINITYNDIVFDITKEETESALTYKISLDDTEAGDTIGLILNFTGLNANAVTENYTMNIKTTDAFDITYTYNNTVSFDGNIEIEPLTTVNAAILNNYSAEQILPFMVQLGTRIAQINTEQMTSLGYNLQYANPLVTWVATPSYITSISMWESVEQSRQEYEDALEQEQEQMDEIEEYMNNIISGSNSETTVDPNDYRPTVPENTNNTTSTLSELERQEIKANNAQFEVYEGNSRGSQAKTLCQTVLTYNLTANENEQINVKTDSAASATAFIKPVNNVNTIKNSINSGYTYEISLSYDSATGKVCEIGIVRK